MAASSASARTDTIIEVVRDAFAPLMRADPVAFRAKYRKMALDPHAFYRGSACLFYNDVTQEPDDWAAHGAERIWIHGDLHVENFGTYLNSDGRLIFDINDFDEAYLGRFAWDLQRFAASLALVGVAEGAARGRRAQAHRALRCAPTSPRSTTTSAPTPTTTSRSASRTPTARCWSRWSGPGPCVAPTCSTR